MQIIECTNRDEWNAILTAYERSSFLQSWEWGEFQTSIGRSAARYLMMEDEEALAAVQLLEYPFRFGLVYAHSPRGPVWAEDFSRQEEVYELVRRVLHRPRRRLFWRLEPTTEPIPKTALRVGDVQPAVTRMLNLSFEKEALLAEMKQKTRYNCRLAEKKGVQISFITQEADPDWDTQLQDWWTLLEETSERHGIRHHPREYYAAMISQLGTAGMLEIARAEHGGQLLAMNIMIGFGDTMTYVHGASTQQQKSLMAPYGLQWAAIERAHDAGYSWYDFYGVAPDGAGDDHKLAGVTRFKTGFGGQVYAYPGTVDLPLRTAGYALYDIVRKFR